MTIIWVVIIALIVWGVVALVKRSSSSSGTSHKRDPLEIARERDAKGEINRDEYDARKKDLA